MKSYQIPVVEPNPFALQAGASSPLLNFQLSAQPARAIESFGPKRISRKACKSEVICSLSGTQQQLSEREDRETPQYYQQEQYQEQRRAESQGRLYEVNQLVSARHPSAGFVNGERNSSDKKSIQFSQIGSSFATNPVNPREITYMKSALLNSSLGNHHTTSAGLLESFQYRHMQAQKQQASQNNNNDQADEKSILSGVNKREFHRIIESSSALVKRSLRDFDSLIDRFNSQSSMLENQLDGFCALLQGVQVLKISRSNRKKANPRVLFYSPLTCTICWKDPKNAYPDSDQTVALNCITEFSKDPLKPLPAAGQFDSKLSANYLRLKVSQGKADQELEFLFGEVKSRDIVFTGIQSLVEERKRGMQLNYGIEDMKRFSESIQIASKKSADLLAYATQTISIEFEKVIQDISHAETVAAAAAALKKNSNNLSLVTNPNNDNFERELVLGLQIQLKSREEELSKWQSSLEECVKAHGIPCTGNATIAGMIYAINDVLVRWRPNLLNRNACESSTNSHQSNSSGYEELLMEQNRMLDERRVLLSKQSELECELQRMKVSIGSLEAAKHAQVRQYEAIIIGLEQENAKLKGSGIGSSGTPSPAAAAADENCSNAIAQAQEILLEQKTDSEQRLIDETKRFRQYLEVSLAERDSKLNRVRDSYEERVRKYVEEIRVLSEKNAVLEGQLAESVKQIERVTATAVKQQKAQEYMMTGQRSTHGSSSRYSNVSNENERMSTAPALLTETAYTSQSHSDHSLSERKNFKFAAPFALERSPVSADLRGCHAQQSSMKMSNQGETQYQQQQRHYQVSQQELAQQNVLQQSKSHSQLRSQKMVVVGDNMIALDKRITQQQERQNSKTHLFF